MRFFSSVILFSFAINFVWAQFTDDFSDGNFTTNPQWSGQDSIFEINASDQLQLNDPNALGEAYLTTQSEAIENAQWEFLVQMDFNPSSSNLARIYLVSDQPNLSGSLNGYFVELGGTSDEISLYRQDGTSDTKIIDGTDDRLDVAAVNVRVQVTRDSSGNWELLADTTGATNFSSEGVVFDNTHFRSAHFGVFCDYTSTRSDKFFFDDFQVSGQPYVDNVAPQLNNLFLQTDSTLLLNFSEAMSSTALATGNYSVNNGIGNPVTVTPQNPDNSEVVLKFTPAFSVNGVYTISFSNLEDLAGNPLQQTSADFTFYTASEGDVLINEILADNSPVQGLTSDSDLEYIELYNRTGFDINLNDWTIEDNLSSGNIPSVVLPADSFAVLAANSDIDSLIGAGFNGIFIAVPSFPGLNNSGELLTLKSPEGTVINQVNYETEWYGDPVKEEGGYSLERIDPNFECGGSENWLASTNPDGGTPGFRNAVDGQVVDTLAPEIASLQIIADDTLRIVFSEKMDSSVLFPVNYSINPATLSVTEVIAMDNLLTEFRLVLNTAIPIGEIFLLTIDNVSDCPGNILVDNFDAFAIPQNPFADDVIISEIMPNPEPAVELPPQEYIEIYNRSNKVFDLENWQLQSNGSSVDLPAQLFLPGERLILVDQTLESLYQNYGAILPLPRLPQLTNSSGELILFSDSLKVIDRVLYEESWYQSTVKSQGGWSLEIIDESNLCEGANNWKASESSLGGTPGQENSVVASNPDETAPSLNRIVYEAGDTLVLFFDSPLDENAVYTAEYSIEPALIRDQVFWSALNPQIVRITLLGSPAAQTIYTLTCTGITDCAGNVIGLQNSAQFGIPENVEANDIIINEILFNPNTGGSDFVELYNRSDKIIDLRNLVIARAPSGFPEDIDDFANLNNVNYQLLPSEFAVLTADPQFISSDYTVLDQRNILEVADLPNYLNSDGIVALLDKSLAPIDQLQYYEDWHFQLLDDVKGVSLERINYERPTQEEDNWHSAAEAAGFATPGSENSNFAQNFSAENNISLEPKIFSPDGDGYNDLLQIRYEFEQPGYVARIRIFDTQGRPIRELANNKLLAIDGYLTWDGTDDEQNKAKIGAYILFFEIFEPGGNTSKFKKSCILGGRLD